MKKTLSLLLAATMLASVSAPVQAAQQFPTVEAAKSKVTNDGYILFIHPEGWDRYGEKLCKKLIADKGVRAAAGDAALILAPIYQNRTEKTNAKVNEVRGHLGYPGDMADISYPALIFYEKGGRQYASIHGEALMNASVEGVAALVKEKMDAKRKQQTRGNKDRYKAAGRAFAVTSHRYNPFFDFSVVPQFTSSFFKESIVYAVQGKYNIFF